MSDEYMLRAKQETIGDYTGALMPLTYYTKSEPHAFYADGLCGRMLFYSVSPKGKSICYFVNDNEFSEPGKLSECVQCLTGMCSELRSNPRGIARY